MTEIRCQKLAKGPFKYYVDCFKGITGVVERIRTHGLVRTKFWKNHRRNTIEDDRFYWDMLIGPDKVLKSGQS